MEIRKSGDKLVGPIRAGDQLERLGDGTRWTVGRTLPGGFLEITSLDRCRTFPRLSYASVRRNYRRLSLLIS